MDKQIKLSVNNLRVSFRTDGGKVQAVRDISFDLYEGETLVETVYGAYSTDTNAMTAKFAAAAILADVDVVAALSPEQKALLESYVA